MTLLNGLTPLDILLIVNSVIIVFIIILDRRKPERTIAWLLIFILFPLLGIVCYFIFGKSWNPRKLPKGISIYNKAKMRKFVKNSQNDDIIPLIKLLNKNSSSPLFLYNDIKLFKDGNEKFDALKEAIKNAQHHIHLEYYIVNNDIIGNEIKSLLIKKANEGVKVRFIIDRIGSIKVKRSFFTEMMQAGIDVVSQPYILASFLNKINVQINYRNHRKIAIIDGKTGFIGGINIGDEYLGKGKLGYWRDTHLMVKGDFVLGLQAVFFDDFLSIKRSTSHKMFLSKDFKKYYPVEDFTGHSMMQFAISGPDSEYPAIMQLTHKMVSIAEKKIYITTPYFIPNESIMDALKAAAISGVDVRIMFPGQYDHLLVYKASLTYLEELAKYGVKIYFYSKKSFLHAKVVTIDGRAATVGSANLDLRSFFINYELNSVIYDKDVISRLDGMFYEDILSSTLISKEFFDNQSKPEKFVQAIAKMFSLIL